MSIPRPEYPRPQFTRPEWLNLNGEWQFEMDPGDSGLERGLVQRELKGIIKVPFCPESTLSGIGHTDFMTAESSSLEVSSHRFAMMSSSWERTRRTSFRAFPFRKYSKHQSRSKPDVSYSSQIRSIEDS